MFLIPVEVELYLRKPVLTAEETEETVNLSSNNPNPLHPYSMSHRWTLPEASCMNFLPFVAVMLSDYGKKKSRGEMGTAAYIAALRTT
jgi:hypothetical protein